MAFVRRVIVLVAILGLGVTAGLVIAGRLTLTSSSDAGPQAVDSTPQPPAGTPTLGGLLPDLSAVAEQAIRASANISSTQFVRVRDDLAAMFGMRSRDYIQPSQSLGSGVI